MLNKYLTTRLVDALLDDTVDLYDVWAGRCDLATDNDVRLIERMYEDVAQDHHYHPDDDFEYILDSVMSNIIEDYQESCSL